MRKTLYIHLGGSKAGSTAIQNYLAMNSADLKERGYHYSTSPEAVSGIIGSGNGYELYDAAAKGDAPRVGELIVAHFGETPNAVVSCEFLQELDGRGLSVILGACESLGVAVESIFYVRDCLPFVYANYDQLIKRHGESRPLNDLLGEVTWTHGEFLRRAYEYKASLGLKVVSYEATRSNLIGNICEWLGVPFLKKSSEGSINVNRSLTNSERDFLIKLNAKFGDMYSQEVSDYFLIKSPEKKSEFEYELQISNKIDEMYTDEIKWINDNYFQEKSIFLNRHAEKKVRAKSKSANDVIELFEDWMISRIRSIRKSTLQEMSDRAKVLCVEDQRDFLDEGVPSEFDPLAYFVLNPDLIEARANPKDHYKSHGRFEGRMISFPGRNYNELISTVSQLKHLLSSKDHTIFELSERCERLLEINSQLLLNARFERRFVLGIMERIILINEDIKSFGSTRDKHSNPEIFIVSVCSELDELLSQLKNSHLYVHNNN